MKRLLAALFAAVLLPVAAAAQPAGVGPGYQLGVEEMNNSGEVGFVTLFRGGPRTPLVVEMQGAENRVQPAVIVRARDCGRVPGGQAMKPAYRVATLRGGRGSGIVPLDFRRLVDSGNYSVVVLSSPSAGARVSACGHLYTS
jgi:hypothetical protein